MVFNAVTFCLTWAYRSSRILEAQYASRLFAPDTRSLTRAQIGFLD